MARTTKSADTPNRQSFRKSLLAWYDKQAVALPWRGNHDAYRTWLSEIMLQQTRVITVQGYFKRFLEKFPDVFALADASQDEVLKLWEGLGYYSRARNLHKTAQIIATKHAGQFPDTAAALRQLPGIGAYTAAAIASIAFNEPIAAVDGNVIRILTRLYDYDQVVGQTQSDKQLNKWAQSLLDHQRPGDYNQAMMDLGRLICLPRNPLCSQCPVQTHCRAATNQTQHLRPVKKAKPAMPLIITAVAILRDSQSRYLLVQRPPSGLLGGLWTFPGGQCNEVESHSDCLKRVLKTDFNVQVRVEQEITTAKQTFTHFHLQVRAFNCQILRGIPRAKDQKRLAWVKLAEMPQYSFGKADRVIADALNEWQPRLFEEP